RRQAQALDAGERIVQETRPWDADRGYTRSMRSKEFAHDYRYFPEPDLVPLRIDRRWVEEIRAALPELPRVWRQRAVAEYGLPPYDAEVLTQSRALVDYYEAARREWGPAPTVERDGRRQVADEGALVQVIDSVMAANPNAIEDYRRGKKEAKGALVGQVMKATRGKANPALVNRLLEDKLSQS